MFPNNSLKSISPDVRMMQAFPNINLGGKPQQIVEDKEGKHPRSRFTSHNGFFITAAPPKLSKIRFPTFALISHLSAQNRVLLTFGGKPQHISEDTLVMMLVNSVNVRRFLR
jgi:hypothetical protein